MYREQAGIAMQIKAIKTRIFKENEKLIPFILQYIKRIPENSIIVITSKIVALAEGRTAEIKNHKEKVSLIKKESSFAINTEKIWLTIKDGLIMASAGIDESNANGKIVFLPKDSFVSAEKIRKTLKSKFKLKNLGVIITDSRILPGRAGVVGIAIGYAGFKGLRNYIGKKDIFGRIFNMSRTDVADCLATSAVLCMGEGNEQKPLSFITEAPIEFISRVNKKELYIDINEDIYKPFFENVKKM